MCGVCLCTHTCACVREHQGHCTPLEVELFLDGTHICELLHFSTCQLHMCSYKLHVPIHVSKLLHLMYLYV